MNRAARCARSDRRIALFLPDLALGGVERRTCDLAGGFVDAGFAVDLVAANGVGPMRAKIPEQVRLVDLRRVHTSSSVVQLASYLRRQRPSVVISAKDHANVVALTASTGSATRTPVVVTVRSRPSDALRTPERWTGHVVRRLIRVAYPRAAAVVAVSRGVAKDLQHVCPGLKVTVIGNPVVSPALYEAAAKPVDHPWFAADRSVPVIVWCGRLSEEKDPLIALAAFEVLRRRRKARLVLIGDGPMRERIDAHVARSETAPDVHMTGYLMNPAPWLARADAFLLTSRREGLPGALIEALALGTPVVSTDCPSGPREILDGGRLGQLVAVGDAHSIAKGLGRALECPPPTVTTDDLAPYTLRTAVGHYVDLVQQVLETPT